MCVMGIVCNYLRFKCDYGICFNIEESAWPYFSLIRYFTLI